MLNQLRKVPRWLYDRLRWDVLYNIEQRFKARRQYDFNGLFALLEKLTGVPAKDFGGYYRELFEPNGAFEEIAAAVHA